MINIKEKKMLVEIDEESSRVLTSAMSQLISWKEDNVCKKVDCNDCQRQGNKLKETDIEKLAKEILDLYHDMYKISMNTTKIPALDEIRKSIINE